MGIYERYAEIYDRVGQSSFSQRMADFTLELMAQLELSQRHILDLACGTGEAALRFARAGHHVVGVDVSTAMLEQARKKASEAGLPITFLEQDVRCFHIDGPMDVVTCFYDSLNYLLHPEELQEVFVRVASVLAPGGLFVCDLNTDVGLARDWCGQIYLEADEEDLLGLHRTRYDGESHVAELHMSHFVRRGEIWERFDEVHAQRGYDRTAVEEMLGKAGLEVFVVRDGALEKASPEAGRLVYVATRD